MNLIKLSLGICDDVVPSFNDFSPNAKVTDSQFRIDLPLLMLHIQERIRKERMVITRLARASSSCPKTKAI